MSQAGRRNTPIDLLAAASSRDSTGAPVETWSRTATLWAEVEVRPAQSETREGMNYTREVTRFTFDWLDGKMISRSSRLLHDGRSWEISYINDMSDTRRMLIVEAVSVLVDTGALREEWRRKMREGIIVTLRREPRIGQPVDCKVRALVTGFRADELVGGINQGDRDVKVWADDVTLDDGIHDGDLVILPTGEHLTAVNVDAYTHRVGDDLIVWELTATGPTN